MTVLPVRPPVSPAQVLLFLEQVREKLTIVGLKEEEYMHTIRRTAESGALGGRIYDALLLAAARKVDPKNIYTWNSNHFRELAPDLAKRIRTPNQG